MARAALHEKIRQTEGVLAPVSGGGYSAAAPVESTPADAAEIARAREALRQAIYDSAAAERAAVQAKLDRAAEAEAKKKAVAQAKANQAAQAAAKAKAAAELKRRQELEAKAAAQQRAAHVLEEQARLRAEAASKKKAAAAIKSAPAAPALVQMAAPPSGLPASKESRLQKLNDDYKVDRITAGEYHEQRAKILLEP